MGGERMGGSEVLGSGTIPVGGAFRAETGDGRGRAGGTLAVESAPQMWYERPYSTTSAPTVRCRGVTDPSDAAPSAGGGGSVVGREKKGKEKRGSK